MNLESQYQAYLIRMKGELPTCGYGSNGLKSPPITFHEFKEAIKRGEK